MNPKETITRLERSFRVNVNNNVSFGVDKVSLTRTRLGVENPFWKHLVAMHLNATTPMTASSETLKLSKGYLQFTEDSDKYFSTERGGYQYSNLVGGIITDMGNSESQADAKAIQDFYGILNKVRRDFSGQQAIGEIRQTIELLKHPFREMTNVLKSHLSVRNKDRSARNKGSAIGAQWLQVRFGILPLAADINGLIQTLQRQIRHEDVLQFKAFGKSEASQQTPVTFSDLYGFMQHGTQINTNRTKVYYSFGYLQKFMSEAEARMEGLRDSFYRLEDLPATMWEVMPWSWLVDYAVNVGSIIEAVTTSTENVVYVSRSVIAERTNTLQMEVARPMAARFVLQSYTPMNGTYMRRTVSRTPAMPGIPPVTFRLPRSNIQLANISAILLQLLKK